MPSGIHTCGYSIIGKVKCVPVLDQYDIYIFIYIWYMPPAKNTRILLLG